MMKNALIHLKEDLQSSIGFRYAAAYTSQSGLDLQVIHVVEPTAKPQDNTGWIRRSWEEKIIASGCDEVNRLIRTENIAYFEAGEPKIAIGDKDEEILDELKNGAYSMYFEGYLNKDNHLDFLYFLDAQRFQEMSCPFLIVKDLVTIDNLFLLVNDEVDADKIIPGLNNLYEKSKNQINLTVLYYKFKKGQELLFREKEKTGSYLDNIGTLLEQNGWSEPEWIVVEGSPKKAAVYMQGYGLVATAFPAKITPRAELLAHLSNPVLIFPR